MNTAKKVAAGAFVLLMGASLLAMRPHGAAQRQPQVSAEHLKLAALSPSSRRDVDYRLLDARLKQLMTKPAMVGLAVVLPSGGEHGWGLPSRLGVVGVGVVAVFVLHRLAAVRVVATDDGVLVVNVIGRRQLEWAEIVGVRLLRDDAWMMLDLADGQSLAAMGVQKSEGQYAQEQAREFAQMVQEHTRVPGHE